MKIGKEEAPSRVGGETRMRTVLLALVAGLLVGCAGGLPPAPSTDQGRVEQAEEMFHKGNYRAAQELLHQFLLDRPGSRYREEAMYWRGRSLLELNLEYEAEEQFQSILRDFPGGEFAPAANYYMGVSLQEQSRPSYLDQTETLAALARFQSFVTRFPDNELAPEAQKRIEELRGKLAKKAYENGRTYMKRGKNFYSAAEFYFKDKVVIPYPDTPWAPMANLELIYSYEYRKDYENAIKWSDHLIREFPDAPQVPVAKKMRCKNGLLLARRYEKLFEEGGIPETGTSALQWATFVVGECPGTGEAKDAREIARKLVEAGVTPPDSAASGPGHR